MEVPDGYFGKIYPRSDLFARHLVTRDGGGVIDSDYCGLVLVLMINHELYLVKKGERISQFVLHKKENISFKQVICLSVTSKGNNGLGSTAM